MAAPTFRTPSGRAAIPTGALAIDYGSGDQTITVPALGVWISATGHLKVDMLNGDTVTWSNMPVGEWVMAITKIYQSGSTASGLVLY